MSLTELELYTEVVVEVAVAAEVLVVVALLLILDTRPRHDRLVTIVILEPTIVDDNNTTFNKVFVWVLFF